MEKVNVIHHMNEFRNILSYATNIGFFFGAGTSCAFGLPNIMTLTSECKNRLSTAEQTLFGKIENSIENLEGKKTIRNCAKINLHFHPLTITFWV